MVTEWMDEMRPEIKSGHGKMAQTMTLAFSPHRWLIEGGVLAA